MVMKWPGVRQLFLVFVLETNFIHHNLGDEGLRESAQRDPVLRRGHRAEVGLPTQGHGRADRLVQASPAACRLQLCRLHHGCRNAETDVPEETGRYSRRLPLLSPPSFPGNHRRESRESVLGRNADRVYRDCSGGFNTPPPSPLSPTVVVNTTNRVVADLERPGKGADTRGCGESGPWHQGLDPADV